MKKRVKVKQQEDQIPEHQMKSQCWTLECEIVSRLGASLLLEIKDMGKVITSNQSTQDISFLTFHEIREITIEVIIIEDLPMYVGQPSWVLISLC